LSKGEEEKQEMFLQAVASWKKMSYAPAHYFKPLCLVGCPCYTPDCQIQITPEQITTPKVPPGEWPPMPYTLPDKLHVGIMQYLPT
jgi:hypothetical protein